MGETWDLTYMDEGSGDDDTRAKLFQNHEDYAELSGQNRGKEDGNCSAQETGGEDYEEKSYPKRDVIVSVSSIARHCRCCPFRLAGTHTMSGISPLAMGYS